MKLIPLGDRVLVACSVEQKEQVTEGGIYVPPAINQRYIEARVIGVGPGKYLQNGQLVPVGVEPGDVVWVDHSNWVAETIMGSTRYILTTEDRVWAKFEDEDNVG